MSSRNQRTVLCVSVNCRVSSENIIMIRFQRYQSLTLFEQWKSARKKGKKNLVPGEFEPFTVWVGGSYLKIMKKFKITTKVIKIIKTLVKLDCGRDFSGSKQKNRK